MVAYKASRLLDLLYFLSIYYLLSPDPTEELEMKIPLQQGIHLLSKDKQLNHIKNHGYVLRTFEYTNSVNNLCSVVLNYCALLACVFAKIIRISSHH